MCVCRLLLVQREKSTYFKMNTFTKVSEYSILVLLFDALVLYTCFRHYIFFRRWVLTNFPSG